MSSYNGNTTINTPVGGKTMSTGTFTEEKMRDLCSLFKKGYSVENIATMLDMSQQQVHRYTLEIRKFLQGQKNDYKQCRKKFWPIMLEYFAQKTELAKPAAPEATNVEVDPYSSVMGEKLQDLIDVQVNTNDQIITLGKCLSLLIEEMGKIRKDMNANADNTQKELRELKSAIECGFRKVRR